ncbi:MAG TPA: hypothetical protein VJ768_09960, partial [Anaerolineales bacterium]|nr:hypothetical protein [Anaerolineales bacterium]
MLVLTLAVWIFEPPSGSEQLQFERLGSENLEERRTVIADEDGAYDRLHLLEQGAPADLTDR